MLDPTHTPPIIGSRPLYRFDDAFDKYSYHYYNIYKTTDYRSNEPINHKPKVHSYIDNTVYHTSTQIRGSHNGYVNDIKHKIAIVVNENNFHNYSTIKKIEELRKKISRDFSTLENIEYYNIVARALYNEGDLNLATKFANFSLRIATRGTNLTFLRIYDSEKHIENSYETLGLISAHLGNYKLAEKCFLKSLFLFEKTESYYSKESSDSLGYLLRLYLVTENFNKAEALLGKFYQLIQKSNDSEALLRFGEQIKIFSLSTNPNAKRIVKGILDPFIDKSKLFKKSENFFINIDQYACIGACYRYIGETTKERKIYLKLLDYNNKVIARLEKEISECKNESDWNSLQVSYNDAQNNSMHLKRLLLQSYGVDKKKEELTVKIYNELYDSIGLVDPKTGKKIPENRWTSILNKEGIDGLINKFSKYNSLRLIIEANLCIGNYAITEDACKKLLVFLGSRSESNEDSTTESSQIEINGRIYKTNRRYKTSFKLEEYIKGQIYNYLGDVYSTQNKKEEAKFAYNQALNNIYPFSNYGIDLKNKIKAL
jgi:hypothetical protein